MEVEIELHLAVNMDHIDSNRYLRELPKKTLLESTLNFAYQHSRATNFALACDSLSLPQAPSLLWAQCPQLKTTLRAKPSSSLS
ncbi:unnamed protein product [Acanthoscelides obtectus]|uniref:Uncharacterized protein n=1 Tax=Acanthoscelides obtectus TaxID=200917 RepID=A0A9P0Q058_ACAOB|nr:unnamed protein product [Acanthoscelides obtectus]CAK1643567.1 hypothetical protein AOBTE_LOCUS13583 [Acanthoscelides obtectus]